MIVSLVRTNTEKYFTYFQIISDAALSDIYDSLINVISADLPSSVYVYNFHYDGELCAMKANCSKRMEKALKGKKEKLVLYIYN